MLVRLQHERGGLVQPRLVLLRPSPEGRQLRRWLPLGGGARQACSLLLLLPLLLLRLRRLWRRLGPLSLCNRRCCHSAACLLRLLRQRRWRLRARTAGGVRTRWPLRLLLLLLQLSRCCF